VQHPDGMLKAALELNSLSCSNQAIWQGRFYWFGAEFFPAPPSRTTSISTREARSGVCQMRCVSARKSPAFALNMFGTQVCGFRS
jgi:hypothetical protein